MATIVGSNGRDLINAPKQGPQVIVARGGDDRILSFRNKDLIWRGGDRLISC